MASLRDLGLSEYEARAYRALLKTGPTTAKELSRVSDVPMGRIYDVLNSIEQYNLVRSQSASRPKKYVAVEASTALDRLLDDKKRELEEKAEQYEEIVDDLTGELETAEPVQKVSSTGSAVSSSPARSSTISSYWEARSSSSRFLSSNSLSSAVDGSTATYFFGREPTASGPGCTARCC